MRGHRVRRMTSGAGHAAQMMARICSSAMIFVPSVNGISHNPREHTEPADLLHGANVLLDAVLALAVETWSPTAEEFLGLDLEHPCHRRLPRARAALAAA